MNIRNCFAAVLLFVLFPGVAFACGIPDADDTKEGVFNASARLKNTAEACIDLNRFVGETIAIDVQSANDVQGRIPGAYLSPFETNVVTIQPGGGRLIVTGARANLQRYKIAFRIIEEPRNPDAIEAEWIFRGGQGFAHPQAVLTDGVREILRLSCVGGESAPDMRGRISPVSVAESFGPQISLGNGGALTWLSVTQQGPDGRWYGMNTLIENRAATADERTLFMAQMLKFGEIDVQNAGAEHAYRRLKSECSSGIAYGDHPSVDCALNARGFSQAACLNPDIGRLDREIAEIYGLLSRLTPISELRTLWPIVSSMMTEHDACADRDLDCYRNALSKARAVLSDRLSPELAAGLEDRSLAPDVPVSPASDELIAELVRYGMSREDAQRARLAYRSDAFSLALVMQPRSADIIVVHTPGHNPDALKMRIDGMEPHVLRAISKHVVPVWITSVEGRVRGSREVVTGLFKTQHIVKGARDDAPVAEGSGFRPFTSANLEVFGWTREDDRMSAATVVSAAADPVTAEAVLSEERLTAEVAERQRLARQERLRQERAEALAYEQNAAQKAGAGGFIYKSAPFWEGFQRPTVMRRIFDGTGGASDQFILGWAAAFYDVCSEFIPADAAVFEDTTVTTWRNGFGVIRSQSVTVDQFRVDRRFEAAVSRARQSPVSTNTALDALNLGSGQPVNWDRVMNAADDLSQPYRDSLRLISAGGCDGPITQQFQRNLLSSIGFGDSAQVTPLLTPSESTAISDRAAIALK